MGMMDVPEMRRLFRVQRFDFWIAVAAVAGTLVFGVLAGVMIGIGLSLLWLISVATRPPMPLLGREQGTQVYRELDEHPTDEQFPGIVVLRLDGGLFFATSDALEDRVREVALSTPDITGIVLDCEGIDFIDSQGSAKMGEILELTNQAGVTLRLAHVKPAVQEVCGATGSSIASARAGLTGTLIEPSRPSWVAPGHRLPRLELAQLTRERPQAR